MNDTQMTVVGNVVESPKLRRTRSGHFVASFRLASTPRRYDREQGSWVDGGTLFVTVTCWRALAENAVQSLRKGQPVVVLGRYCQRDYEKDETVRTAYELEASAIGHDLSRGVSSFQKVSRPALATAVPVDDEGVPADETDHYLDIAADPALHEIDVATGEVRELSATG